MTEQQLAAVKQALENITTAKDLCDKHSKLDRRIVYGNALIAHFDAVCQALAERPAQPVPVKTYHDGKPWPVAPKPWVGLTKEDKEFIELTGGKSDVLLAELVEAKLREKNGGAA
jgi:hypothetical protein